MRRLKRKIDRSISKLVHRIWNPYNLNLPGGNCPVQAEGYLPTGEFYYFRSRWSTWRMYFSRSESHWIEGKYLFVYKQENFCEEPLAGWISISHAYILMNKATKAYYKTQKQNK
jgi:hypothetical protein